MIEALRIIAVGSHLGYNAGYVALVAVLVLLVGIVLAGWLHSKFVGIVATVLGGGAVLALLSALTVFLSA